MSAFIGALLDVSGSMKSSIGDGIDEEGGTWAHSIFRVANDLVKHDISRSNRVFVIGLGALYSQERFDIISTVEQCQNTEGGEIPLTNLDIKATDSTIENIFILLEQNGAHTIRRWAEVNVVKNAVSEYMATIVLRKLRSDRNFTQKFVREDLPTACRSWEQVPGGSFLQSVFSIAVTPFRNATKGDIEEVIAKALMKGVCDQSVYNVKDAANVLHGCLEERDLTSRRVRELLKLVEPFIYGNTPLYSALYDAFRLFQRLERRYPNHHRLLFVLSDGNPTDFGNISSIQSDLKRAEVKVVSCYISRSSHVEPRMLPSVAERRWEEGAKFLFDLSSYIPTSLVTRAIFIKNGWKIEITNNETRLFMHVNHPDNLKDVCNLARNAVCCQDSLSDVLVSISLDIYINQRNQNIEVHDQGNEGTCYAHAAATVLHLAMYRILGRDDGYPEFEELRDDMINRHGRHGANTLRVLEEICPMYRLRCREVDVNGAMEAITEKRPVVAKFRLTREEWNTFHRFYERNRTGILTSRDLDICRRRRNSDTSGHAVVLTSFDSECFRLMNSYGEDWGDTGFFRIENAEVLDLKFIDVYWESGDLSQRERRSYSQHGTEVADKLMKTLKALQVATFTCPLCGAESNVNEFRGTLSRACCPRCNGTFSSSRGDGNILALNIYLTSLSR
ncbi:uncharacterized protein LOC123531720 [Mercenaria mercenaria]|uniref:uncharacterized protein LOC123531720 n=1 Tax=Mercenaria mercenaria TaxID=6596 RepID=UPI00234F3371|nr:uncharacterized protein LOC123531720 [Mercenaria mercenaria]